MGIPVNALTEDELLHYAGLDPDAAAELTRRISAGDMDPGAELEEAQEEVRRLEYQVSDIDDDLENLRDNVVEACGWIRRAMDPDDETLTHKQLLQKALDCLE
jgi:hypothetical protein